MKRNKVKPRPDTRRNTDPRRPQREEPLHWSGPVQTYTFELPVSVLPTAEEQ